ncbi:MAG: hypothetical protein R2715_12735 [Ilumatobacteraceae bacterium]
MIRLVCSGPDSSSLGPAEAWNVADELDVSADASMTIVDSAGLVLRATLTVTTPTGAVRSVVGAPMAADATLPPACP